MMSKIDFMLELVEQLSPLPWEEVEDRWDFYSEMIDDYMEEGLTEDEAVAKLGTVEEIAAQILADTPLTKLVKARIKPKRRLSTGEIVFLALGSPIWLSLCIAAFAVIFAFYISLWAVIISLWAVFVSFAACAIGGVSACVIFTVGGSGASGIAMLAAGIVCAGLAIFMFYGCKAASKGSVRLTKKVVLGVKNCFVKRREHNG